MDFEITLLPVISKPKCRHADPAANSWKLVLN